MKLEKMIQNDSDDATCCSREFAAVLQFSPRDMMNCAGAECICEIHLNYTFFLDYMHEKPSFNGKGVHEMQNSGKMATVALFLFPYFWYKWIYKVQMKSITTRH
jgi:hypothetical protein